MKVAAITRFKHGKLWEALKELGWSQKRLADETGLPEEDRDLAGAGGER